jgi:hypothetical protein
MICCEAAQTKNKGLVLRLMRRHGERPLSAQDMNDIADYWEGKFNNRRGRPEDLDEYAAMLRAADEVRKLKRAARAQGARLKHWDAIDRVVEKYPEESRSALWIKLRNFLSRSKQRKKVAQ